MGVWARRGSRAGVVGFYTQKQAPVVSEFLASLSDSPQMSCINTMAAGLRYADRARNSVTRLILLSGE